MCYSNNISVAVLRSFFYCGIRISVAQWTLTIVLQTKKGKSGTGAAEVVLNGLTTNEYFLAEATDTLFSGLTSFPSACI